jgi:hypothetical protein
MTTYNAAAVADSKIAFQKGITLQQGRALRDNALAIAEGDVSVAANLFPTVLLGTLTTTSGTSQSLTSLVLTPYKFLMFEILGVSLSAVDRSLLIGGQIAATIPEDGSPTSTFYGIAFVSLGTGQLLKQMVDIGTARNTGYSTATTTVTVSVSGGSNFDAGSIRVYGMK